jgi:hypothetical protein
VSCSGLSPASRASLAGLTQQLKAGIVGFSKLYQNRGGGAAYSFPRSAEIASGQRLLYLHPSWFQEGGEHFRRDRRIVGALGITDQVEADFVTNCLIIGASSELHETPAFELRSIPSRAIAEVAAEIIKVERLTTW